MSWNEAGRTTGLLLLLLGGMLLVTAGLGGVMENAAWGKLLAVGLVWLLLGSGLRWFLREERGWFAANPFLVAAYCWGLASVLGSVPYWLALPGLEWGAALFESVAGFTGTAASLWSSTGELPQMLIWWRSLSQWMGGLGGILLLQGLLPLMGLGDREGGGKGLGWKLEGVLRMALPVYVGGTAFLGLLLVGVGLPWWQAGVHAMAAVSTGGLFGELPQGAGRWVEWLLTLGMWVGGMNFVLLGMLCCGRLGSVSQDVCREWIWYVSAGLLAVIALTLFFLGEGVSVGERVHEGVFHAVSMLSTTGYVRSGVWNVGAFVQTLLLMLMWVGACTVSGGSGVRWRRIMLMERHARKGLLQMVHPAAVLPQDSEYLQEEEWRDLGGVLAFLLLHLGCWFLLSLLLTLDGRSALAALSSALSALNNVGPAFGEMAGKEGARMLSSWEDFSDFGRAVAMFAMLAGKLEILTVYALLVRRGGA